MLSMWTTAQRNMRSVSHQPSRGIPRGAYMPLGLSCLCVLILFYVTSWDMGSTVRAVDAVRGLYQVHLSADTKDGHNRSQVAEAPEVKHAASPSTEGKSDGGVKRRSLLDPTYRNFKTILYWNDVYGAKSFFFGEGHEPFVKANCRVKTCYATSNRSLLVPEEADAVMWHLRSNDRELPAVRSPHTFYTFWVIESALYTYGNLNIYNGVFNWTMTYRLDSDFPRPYGRIKPPLPNASLQVVQPRNYAAGKTKLAAWFVSNCNTLSGREHLRAALELYIPIDVYGHCGNLTCARNAAEECHQMLQSDYKFYFAFENSLCMDYITEKFFLNINYDVVMVVYGLGYHKLNLPKHSYIDVTDFSSVRHLVAYLQYLDSNDTAYNEYFRWKTLGYRTVDETVVSTQPFCDLCAALHAAHEPPEQGGTATYNEDPTAKAMNIFHRPVIKEGHRKVYTNLHEWFVEGQCVRPSTDQILAAFIHGRNVSREEIQSEESVFPALLRSKQTS